MMKRIEKYQRSKTPRHPGNPDTPNTPGTRISRRGERWECDMAEDDLLMATLGRAECSIALTPGEPTTPRIMRVRRKICDER